MKRVLSILVLGLLAGCASHSGSLVPDASVSMIDGAKNASLASLFDESDAKKTPVVCDDEKICVPLYKMRGEVDGVMADDMIQWIAAANDKQVKAIVIEIHSPGGSVPAGFDIAKAIEDSAAPVTCVVDGEAASMAAYILESCTVRTMTTRSMVMFHEPSMGGNFSGTPNEWQAIANWLYAMREAITQQCTRRMNISAAEFHKRTDGGLMWWLAWNDATKYEAVDHVVNSVKDVVAQLKK